MTDFFSFQLSKTRQLFFVALIISAVAGICFSLSGILSYRVVALILLVTVSLIAMFLDILPVILAACLSALIWDYFFIPPRFAFQIATTEDALFLLMYFIIALVNTVLTFKIRQVENRVRKKRERTNTIRLYNTLLNSLSHELKTPISAILGSSDNLLTNNSKLSEDNKVELYGEISKAALRLNQQVENLLNISRIESGFIQPKMDWCDINELVYSAVNRVKEQNSQHPVNVQVKDNLPLFKVDFGLIEQVLFNLISNAARYIPKYAIISVRAVLNNENLILVVEDTGKGFPPEELDKVFGKFYRLKGTETGGIGLGLSIAKGFVEAHNGTIKLENIEDGGAKFTIEIPAEFSNVSQLKNE